MSAFTHMMSFKTFLEQRTANGLPIYVQKANGKYGFHPDVEAEFAKTCKDMNNEYAPTDKYSPSQVQRLRQHVKYFLNFGYKPSVYNQSLRGTEKAEMAKFRREQHSLLMKYFGGLNIDQLSDQDFVTIYDRMTTEMSNYSKLNSVLMGKLKDDPAYKAEQEEKKKKNFFQKIASNKVFKAVIGNRIKALFTEKDSPLMQQSKGLKPISKDLRLANINALIAAFENLPDMEPQTIQPRAPQTAAPVTPVSPQTPNSTQTQGVPTQQQQTQQQPVQQPIQGTPKQSPVIDKGITDEEMEEENITGAETDNPSNSDSLLGDETPVEEEPTEVDVAEGPVYEEPEVQPKQPKTTKISKTVREVKPITEQEVLTNPEKFAGDYPTMTHIDDSNGRKPLGWNHVGEIAIGRDEKGNAIIANVYQNPNSNQLYYGNSRVNARVNAHKYVNEQINAGQDFGEIKVGKKNDIPFRYKINGDGTVSFVSSELVKDVMGGKVPRTKEEYNDTQVEVEVPFDGNPQDTQEQGAPVALVESINDYDPPAEVPTRTIQVKTGNDPINSEVKTYEYYEDPHNKGTFFVRELGTSEQGTMFTEAEFDQIPTRLVLHSDAYDQDFNFDMGNGFLKNADQVVEQERIDAERARHEELEKQQAEELRIQQEQAEIDRKRDYIHNGPNPELYDFGDKKYPEFKHIEHPKDLHGYTKLSTLVPVGVWEQTLPDGTKQQKVVAVEIWRSNTDPNQYRIGNEVNTDYGVDRYRNSLDWEWGHSPVIDVNNHLGFNDRPSVNVVIGRDSNGKLTVVSADFIQDYEAGQVTNKFSEQISGMEEPKPDVTAKISDGEIYARLHEKEYLKYCKKHKLPKHTEASSRAFFESQANAAKEVAGYRGLANDEAKMSHIIDNNKIINKQYQKFRKKHPNMSEQEARNQFAVGYYAEMLKYQESGKIDKFEKKYAKGWKGVSAEVEAQRNDPIGETVVELDQVPEMSPEQVRVVAGAPAPVRENAPVSANNEAPTNNNATPGVTVEYNPAYTGAQVVVSDATAPAPTTVEVNNPAKEPSETIRTDAPNANNGVTVEYDPSFTGPTTEVVYNPEAVAPTQATPTTPTQQAPVQAEPTPQPQPTIPVNTGKEELPFGIENTALDCMWKDILTEVGGLTKSDGTPYIGSRTLQILKLAAGDPSAKADKDIERKMDEIILTTYENAHLRAILKEKGLSKLPEGQEGLDMQAEAKKKAKEDFDKIFNDPELDINIVGKARLTLQELSKARFNPNNGKELVDGEIPDDYRRDSFFYRGLCKAGIDFDFQQYLKLIQDKLYAQLPIDVKTGAGNMNFDPNNIDPSKFTEATVIGENGKEIKVHKITVNGIEVYMTEDHKTILEVSDNLVISKVSGNFGTISMEEIIGQVRDARQAQNKTKQEQKQDARWHGSDDRTI